MRNGQTEWIVQRGAWLQLKTILSSGVIYARWLGCLHSDYNEGPTSGCISSYRAGFKGPQTPKGPKSCPEHISKTRGADFNDSKAIQRLFNHRCAPVSATHQAYIIFPNARCSETFYLEIPSGIHVCMMLSEHTYKRSSMANLPVAEKKKIQKKKGRYSVSVSYSISYVQKQLSGNRFNWQKLGCHFVVEAVQWQKPWLVLACSSWEM